MKMLFPFIKQKNIRAIQNLSLMKTFVISAVTYSRAHQINILNTMTNTILDNFLDFKVDMYCRYTLNLNFISTEHLVAYL